VGKILKILKILAITGLASLSVVGSLGCGAAVLQSIKASPSTLSLSANATQQLTITASDSKGISKTVTTISSYSSSNMKIATVTTGGLVKGIVAGSATITVSYREGTVTKTVTVPVTVEAAAALSSIKAGPSTLSLSAYATQQLTITASDSKGISKTVTTISSYSSSNATIATVTTGGLVKGIAVGSTSITVSYAEGGVNKTVAVPVTVK
jgi:uncharacterized protein YjdB